MQLIALLILLSLLLSWWPLRPWRNRTSDGATSLEPSANSSLLFAGGLWFFATFVDVEWATGLGALYLACRLPALRERREPSAPSRTLVFARMIELILILGALAGLGRHWSMLS